MGVDPTQLRKLILAGEVAVVHQLPEPPQATKLE
jgi:hypothetical protein